MDLLYFWYDSRYWSNILFDTTPIPGYYLKVKYMYMDLEIYVKVLCWSF